MELHRTGENRYGVPDSTAHGLCVSCRLRNKNALAFVYHLLCSSSGLSLADSRKVINKFTNLGVHTADNNITAFYISRSAFSFVYNNERISNYFRNIDSLEVIDEYLNSRWAKYVSHKIDVELIFVWNFWRELLVANRFPLGKYGTKIITESMDMPEVKGRSDTRKTMHSDKKVNTDSHTVLPPKIVITQKTVDVVQTRPDNNYPEKDILEKQEPPTQIESRVAKEPTGMIDMDKVVNVKNRQVATPSETENNLISQFKQATDDQVNLGLDLCNHKLNICQSSYVDSQFAEKIISREQNKGLPSVLLPSWPREKLLIDVEAVGNRRGLGLLWPPESQMPINADYENGVGRVPIVGAICKMHAEGLKNEWKSFLDSSVYWNPRKGITIRKDATKLVARSIKVNCSNADAVGLVIPEGFTEGAQQALLDSCLNMGFDKVNLIPRSVSIALKWCQENDTDYSALGVQSSEGKKIGYIATVSLGMDLWEVKVIELRAVTFAKKTWLVPIHDPTIGSVSLDFCGMSLCSEMLSTYSSKQTWYALHGTDWYQQCLNKGVKGHMYDEEAFLEAIRQGRIDVPFNELDVMSGIYSLHADHLNLRKTIADCVNSQLQALRGSNSEIRAIIACGSFARMEVLEGKTAGKYLLGDIANSSQCLVQSGEYSAAGAAKAAAAIFNKLPSYRVKLIPVDIYTVGRSSNGDKEVRWIPLIKGETVEAGRKYEPKEPIEGLSIPNKSEKLTLTLRRPSSADIYIFRQVDASLPQKTENKEAVEVFVSVKPGQGFSRVDVKSKTPGVFSTLLDWRSMKEVEEPELPFLEYIPNVSYIEARESKFRRAVPYILSLTQQLENGSYSKWTVDLLREQLCKWPSAVTEMSQTLQLEDLFKHVGVLNSNGSMKNIPNGRQLMKLLSLLDNTFKARNDLVLLRLGAWFYRLLPPAMLRYTEECFFSGSIGQVELHTAGLCFHTNDQLKLYFSNFASECRTDSDVSSEWFRTLRNIVRFQDHALADNIVNKYDLELILETLLTTFERTLMRGVWSNTLNNCLQASLFILKRRRYDESFLDVDHSDTKRLENLLVIASDKHRIKKYRAFAAATLNFLHKKATAADASKVLES